MNIKILIATHKEYKMPEDNMYLPIHVGKEGKEAIGYIGDNTGDNISKKNPYYCELTGLYWGIKNLECDYIGLVHYRRHFSNESILKIFNRDKYKNIIKENEIKKILTKYDVILPKKRHYIIENLYDHYEHTHHIDHLDITREIIKEICPEYLISFDCVMKRRSAHMFNMFVMKKKFANQYCEWLFKILYELEKQIDITQYDSFQARLFGRVSELLLDVWIEHNKIVYKEIPYLHIEKVNWVKKGSNFLRSKIFNRKLEKSF
mgnify:CR=1 FL=1